VLTPGGCRARCCCAFRGRGLELAPARGPRGQDTVPVDGGDADEGAGDGEHDKAQELHGRVLGIPGKARRPHPLTASSQPSFDAFS